MISNELQYQVHLGDSKAFQTLFSLCGKDVYLVLLNTLGSVADARAAVKRVFLSLQHELIEAPGPIDADARIAALTKEELLRSMAAQAVAPSGGMPLTWEDCKFSASPASPPRAAEPAQAAPPPLSASSQPESPMPEPSAPPPPPPVEEPPAPPKPRRKRGGLVLLWLAVILLGALFCWFLLDVLMKLQLIPRVDLGYSWFNEHVFRLFSQP